MKTKKRRVARLRRSLRSLTREKANILWVHRADAGDGRHPDVCRESLRSLTREKANILEGPPCGRGVGQTPSLRRIAFGFRFIKRAEA